MSFKLGLCNQHLIDNRLALIIPENIGHAGAKKLSL